MCADLSGSGVQAAQLAVHAAADGGGVRGEETTNAGRRDGGEDEEGSAERERDTRRRRQELPEEPLLRGRTLGGVQRLTGEGGGGFVE